MRIRDTMGGISDTDDTEDTSSEKDIRKIDVNDSENTESNMDVRNTNPKGTEAAEMDQDAGPSVSDESEGTEMNQDAGRSVSNDTENTEMDQDAGNSEDVIPDNVSSAFPFLYKDGTPNRVEISLESESGEYQITINDTVPPSSFLKGIVWQWVEDGLDADYYARGKMHVMLGALLPPDHGIEGLDTEVVPHNLIEDLVNSNTHLLRLYQLPTDQTYPESARQVKLILKHLYQAYDIMVNAGNWAGLYDHAKTESELLEVLNDPEAHLESEQLKIQDFVYTWKNEPYIFAYQIGNENNFFVPDSGQTPKFNWNNLKFDDGLQGYYQWMNNLALTAQESDTLRPVF